MAEPKRNKKRDEFRQQLSQTWDDAQINRPPHDPPESWESERVVEIKRSAPLPTSPAPMPPPDMSTEYPKTANPVFKLICTTVRRDGFTHPEEGNFVMLPKEFAAVLALENKSLVQVVLLVICETVGWTDDHGRSGRREWARIGQKYFNKVCGSSGQGHNGLKKALQKGFIIRRPCGNSFEYSIRWKDKDA